MRYSSSAVQLLKARPAAENLLFAKADPRWIEASSRQGVKALKRFDVREKVVEEVDSVAMVAVLEEDPEVLKRDGFGADKLSDGHGEARMR